MNDVIGVALAVLMLIACLLLFKPTSDITGILVISSVLSPPVLLAIERGNNDLFIFFILISGLLFTKSFGSVTALFVRSALILFLAILKVYPAAASAIFVQRSLRGFFWAAALVLASLGSFVYFAGDKLLFVYSATQQDAVSSFGAAPIFYYFANYLGIPSPSLHVRLLASAFAVTCGLVVIVAAVRLPMRWLDNLVPPATDDIAVACVSIYAFAFLLGSNYDYRLIFLLGAMPLLLERLDRCLTASALLPPAVLVLFFWMSRVAGENALLDEPLDWIIYVSSVAWLTRSMLNGVQLPVPHPTDSDMEVGAHQTAPQGVIRRRP
jgi:hypothetical protein